MTFGEITTMARQYSRVTVSGISDSDVYEFINQAMVAFARDAYGLPYKEYITVAATFDLQTAFAFHLEIVGSTNNDIDSDIAVIDVSALDQTGAQVATGLQAQVRSAIGAGADLTIAWTNFYFTIDGIDSTSMEISTPSSLAYVDYVNELFGGAKTGTTSITGGFPKNCTVQASLSANVMRVNKVEWNDTHRLRPVPRNAFIGTQYTGTPRWYNVRGAKISLYPIPTTIKKLYIEYKGIPNEVGSPVSTSTVDDIDSQYHLALAYWVASQLLLQTHEDKLSINREFQYKKVLNQYKLAYANNSTDTSGPVPAPLWYGVEGA